MVHVSQKSLDSFIIKSMATTFHIDNIFLWIPFVMHANCFYSLVFFCAKTYHKIYLCKFWLKTENMRNFLPEQCKMPKVKLCKFGYNMVSLKSLIICVLVCLLSLWSVFYNVLLVKNQQGCLWLVSWFFFFFLELYKSCLQNEHIICVSFI